MAYSKHYWITEDIFRRFKKSTFRTQQLINEGIINTASSIRKLKSEELIVEVGNSVPKVYRLSDYALKTLDRRMAPCR